MTISTNIYPDLLPALNIAEMDVIEGAAGPGRRLVLWMQGCLKRCPGCANGDFLTTRRRKLVSVKELCDLLETLPELDGITLSGGEPILQADAVVPFLTEVHLRNITVVCYSGYTLEELRSAENHARLAPLLDHVDLLIDGEYRKELPQAGLYRPSANQRLHFLSGRIAPEECADMAGTVFVLHKDHAVVTGTFPMALRREIYDRLGALGVAISPATPDCDSPCPHRPKSFAAIPGSDEK